MNACKKLEALRRICVSVRWLFQLPSFIHTKQFARICNHVRSVGCIHAGLGEKVVYLAGDRVVSDLMSKPFSMGRNLLCIHSKKHMAADDSTTKYVHPVMGEQNFFSLVG